MRAIPRTHRTRTLTGLVLAAAALGLAPTVGSVDLGAQGRRAVSRPAPRRAVPRPAYRYAPRRVIAPRYRSYGYNGYGVYSPFYYGSGFYGYGPYAYGPYGYYPYAFDGRSAVRLQVKPESTEVFVDGYYAGVVDSYDGVFQRLRLAPGRYVIELYLDGYEPVRESVSLQPGQTYRIQRLMRPRPEGAPAPPRPEPLAPLPDSPVWSGAPPPRSGTPVDAFGTLVVRVNPPDAAVFVDGEQWVGFEDVGELTLDLGPGLHQLEVSRIGYRTYRTDVEVTAGAPTVVNVSLPSEGPPR